MEQGESALQRTAAKLAVLLTEARGHSVWAQRRAAPGRITAGRQLPLWAVEPDAPLCIEARAWMPLTSSGRSLLAFWPKHLFLAEREVGTRKLVGRIHRDRLFKKRPSFFQPPRLEE